MRVAIVLAYVLLVAVAAAAIAAGVPPPRLYVTTATLRPNHRIASGDVVEASGFHRFLIPALTDVENYRGRYVRTSAPVPAHEPITLAATAGAPAVAPPAGAVLVWVPYGAGNADLDALDVGSIVDVCGLDAHERCANALSVGAISCDGTGRATCSAGIWVTDAVRADILSGLDAVPRSRVRLLVRHVDAGA